MPDKERKILTALSTIIVVCMLICAFFAWHRSPHSFAWHQAFYALGLLNSFVYYRRFRNKPMPDTLISLFPKTTQQSPESPNP
jgi:hypothetical protein